MTEISKLSVTAATELPGTIEELFDKLTTASLVWHEVHVPNFSGKDAARYISSPDLIRSEVAEMCKAIEQEVPHELIDALIDIYWEITPVIELLEPVLDFSKVLVESEIPNPSTKLLQDTLHYYSGLLLFDYHYVSDFESFEGLSTPSAISDLVTLKCTIQNFLFYLVWINSISFEELEECIDVIIRSNESKSFPADISTEVMDTLQDELAEQYPDVEVVAVFCNTSEGEKIIFRNAETGKTLKHDGYYFRADLSEVLHPNTTKKIAEEIREFKQYRELEFVPNLAKLIGM